MTATRHGHATRGKMSRTYTSWSLMKRRCYSPRGAKYPRYGGRGIIVCERWLESFDNFLADMGERPAGTTLDRIDRDGHYEPSNCQWSTPRVQSNNFCRNVVIEHNGQSATIADWARTLGIDYYDLYNRVRKCRRRGCPLSDAITPSSPEYHVGANALRLRSIDAAAAYRAARGSR